MYNIVSFNQVNNKMDMEYLFKIFDIFHKITEIDLFPELVISQNTFLWNYKFYIYMYCLPYSKYNFV